MLCTTNHLIKQGDRTSDASSSLSNIIPVNRLYLSHLSEDNDKGILITSVKIGSTSKNRISLKLDHPGNFGDLQLSYTGPRFHDYFPPNATFKVSKLLLKKSTTIHRDVHNGSWEIMQIKTKKESDCNYLFKKAIEDNYIAILAIQFEIINRNNLSRKFTLYLHDDNGTPLHRAAAEEDLKTIEALLKCNLDINEKNLLDKTPLHNAVVTGNVNIIDILLKNGADCKLTDLRDRTPFHLAAKRHNFDIIKVFLENNINFQDSQGFTPPYVAENVLNIEFIRILLKYNADMNIQLIFGRNIFHLACQHLSYECIEAFLNFNIDIDAVDIEGKTALHVAVERKHCRVVELILQKNSNINMCDSRGKTPLHLASELRSLSMIKLLLRNEANVDLGDKFGNTALHLAIKPTYDCIIKLLLKNNANVNLTNALGETVLLTTLKTAGISEDVIKSILNSSSDINAKDSIGRTAVHYAALNHNVTTLRCLLEKNANVNAKDSEGKTPLHLTINLWTRCFECVKVLLDHKADITTVDNNLTSPLHIACFNKNADIVKYLIENGADSNIKDKDGRTVFHYVFMSQLNGISLCINNMKKHIEDILIALMKENISVNCCDIYGKTPLHYAAESDSLSVINELLLNIGADINAMDKDNNTAFDKLFKQENYPRYDSLLKHIVKMKVLKLWVREKILDKIYKVNNKRYLEWIQSYENVCSREIDVMKSTYLDKSNITYYDFLKKSPHYAVNYARNQSIVKAIQSNGLIKMFPRCAYFLKNHLRETQQRRNLYDQIQESLKLYFFQKLPILCMYEVLRYLDHSELNLLLKAMESVILIK